MNDININDFLAAYEQPDLDVFMAFCQKHSLINDDVIKLLEKAYGKKYIEELLNANEE